MASRLAPPFADGLQWIDRFRKEGLLRASAGIGPVAALLSAQKIMSIIKAALADSQFALTAIFHMLWPVLSTGLAIYLVVLEAIWLRTRNPLYYRQARFWAKLYVLNFGIGVASGLPLEFQFGTNWAPLSEFAGDFFGSVLGFEGAMAFMLEAGFLGILPLHRDGGLQPLQGVPRLTMEPAGLAVFQQGDLMAASAARHHHPARCLGRQRVAAQELGQRWGGLTKLPAVSAFLVALVPVARIGAGGLSGGAHVSSLPCSIATCVESHGGIAVSRLGNAVEHNRGGWTCMPI